VRFPPEDVEMRALFLGSCAIALLVSQGCHDAWQDGKLGTDRHDRIGATAPDMGEVESDPQILPQTYMAAGRLGESRGDLILAASMYSKAAALDQDCVDAHARLGLTLVRMGRYKQAEGALLTAVELAPEKAYLRNNLAFAYLQQQQWPQAETALREALQLQPTFARARVNLGMVLARTGHYQEAMEQFLQVLPPASAHYNLGLIHEINCRHELAQASFTQALALNPHMAPAREGLKRVAGVVRPADASGDVVGVAQAQRGMTLEHAIQAPAIVEAEPASAVSPEPPPMPAPAVRRDAPQPEQNVSAPEPADVEVDTIETAPTPMQPEEEQEKSSVVPADISNAGPTEEETVVCAVGPEAPDELLVLLASSEQDDAPASEMAARLLRSAADWWSGEGGQGFRRRLDRLFSSGIGLPETDQVAEGRSVGLGQ